MTPQDKLAVAHALTQLAYTAPEDLGELKAAAAKRAWELLLELADLPIEK